MSSLDRKAKEKSSPLEFVTWAELAEYGTTPEGKAEAHHEEAIFRKGFYYGADEVIEALARGVNLRQLLAWLNSEVFEWWYHPKDGYNNCLVSPSPPIPWAELREKILKRDNRVCRYCGGEANSVDHVVPYKNGGADDEDNLVACCTSCNASKGIKSLDEWVSRPAAGSATGQSTRTCDTNFKGE